jgi:LuxR family maltose regulon positive regulatory protein
MTPDGSGQAATWPAPVSVARGGIVSRPRLFDRLDSAARVTQISSLAADIADAVVPAQQQPGKRGLPGPGRSSLPKAALPEPLTESETRVLRYLPTNLPAPEIANELTLSVNTVRTHIRHLYEKLAAHSRTGAVEQARALGLLAPSARQL